MARPNLAQIREDLDHARDRLAETYYEWAAQLAREAASDALALVEIEAGWQPPAEGEIGELGERTARLVEAELLDEQLASAAAILDEVLDPTLEPDHDPGLERREGGSRDYLEAGDAEEAIEAAASLADACQAQLET
jgi:HEPN domain-containing protein